MKLPNNRCLPDALVIGPMRTATTWIHQYLENRDDVCLPTDVKETFFFDRRFGKGLDWYSGHFESCHSRGAQITIEVGPSYFHSEEAPRRIRDTLGQIPLVIVYRNPVERSFSHFAHLRRYGFTDLPLLEAAKEYPEVLEASRYAQQLEHWIDHFGRKNLRILHLQTLKESSNQFVFRLNQALGLPQKPVPEELKTPVNQSAIPKNNTLAGVAWRIADVLRGWRLHKIVEWAKQIGLKDAVMKGNTVGRKTEMSEFERAWLREELKEDLRRVSHVVAEVEKK